MSSSNVALDVGVKDAQSTTSSFIDGAGTSDGAANFYNAELDKVQRKLSGVHVQMYVRPRCPICLLHAPFIIRFAVRAFACPMLGERICVTRIRLLASSERVFS